MFLVVGLLLGGYVSVAEFLLGAYPPRLFVTAHVEIPRGIDARTQELFRELGRLLPRQGVRP